MLRAYKYRIYPTKDQKVLLAKHFGCARWVYNYGLAAKTKAYTGGQKLTCIDVANTLTALKEAPETQWLKEVNSQSLQMALRNLDNAYTQFFKKKAKFPRFKSKRDNQHSFQCPQHVSVDTKASKVFLPKFREGIEVVFHRKFEGEIRTVTVSKNAANRYFVSILVEDGKELPEKKPVSEKAVGIDMGLSYFCVLSDGRKIENPRFFEKLYQKLAAAQRNLSRKQKGSANREKARLRVARVHEHIANKRKDFLHKVSHQIVSDNQVDSVCLEDLSVTGMLKNRSLASSISDVGWSTFKSYLEYKTDWCGKNVLFVGQFFPSSKMCSKCGNVKKIGLDERIYDCECGHVEDRDVNAAKNIRKFALISKISGGDASVEPVESSSRRGRKTSKYKLSVTRLQRDEEAGRSSGDTRSPRF